MVEQREIDVVVAADDAPVPGERTVRALGEAKVGERITLRHMRMLQDARTAFGAVAASAKLLLFGQSFDEPARAAAANRHDLEIIGPEAVPPGPNEDL